MKVIKSILFALTVTLLFRLVLSITSSYVSDLYFDKEGKEAFVDSNPDKYRFFYGTTGFHKKEATYTLEDNDYKVQFFEIGKLFKNKNNDVKVEEYFYIMIDNPNKILTIDNPQIYYIKFLNNQKEELTLRIFQFKELPFSVVVNEDDEGLINVSDIYSKNYNKVIIYDDSTKENLFEQIINLNENDLTIKDKLLEFNNDLEELKIYNIYNPIKVSTKYNWILYLVIILYVILLTIVMYFMFYRKKRSAK